LQKTVQAGALTQLNTQASVSLSARDFYEVLEVKTQGSGCWDLSWEVSDQGTFSVKPSKFPNEISEGRKVLHFCGL
jgi:hypothetical protein